MLQTFIRTLVVAAIASGVLVGTAAPAAACTCGHAPVVERLEAADGAFVGSLIGADPATLEPITVGDSAMWPTDVVYTFEVEEWIKGDRSDARIDVVGPLAGAGCGLMMASGTRVVMLVDVRDGRAHSGLCSLMDEGELRGATEPVRSSDEAAVFLAAPGWPEKPVLLGPDGTVVGERPDGAHGRRHVSCGGAVVAEERNREVALVDVATFADIEVLQFRRGASQLLCEAEWLLGVSEREGQHEVFDVRSRRSVAVLAAEHAPVALHDGQLTFLGPEDAFGPPGWRLLDLETQELASLTPFDPELPTASIAVSPDGLRAAYVPADIDPEIVVLDLPSGTETRREISSRSVGQWLTNGLLFVSGNGGSSGPQVLEVDTLRVVAELDPRVGGQVELIDDDTLLSVSGGTIATASLTDGGFEVQNQLAFTPRIVRLPEPTQVSFAWDAPTGIETPIPSPVLEALPASSADLAALVDPIDHFSKRSASVPDEVADGEVDAAVDAAGADSPIERSDSGGWGLVGALLAAAVVAAGVAASMRRRKRRS